jgi:hypothetical protein
MVQMTVYYPHKGKEVQGNGTETERKNRDAEAR